MTFENLIDLTKEKLSLISKKPNHQELANFQIEILGECSGKFSIIIKNQAVILETKLYPNPDASFRMQHTDFLKLIDGTLGAVSAYSSGKLVIRGNIFKAMRLGELLSGK